jgi:probable HAF family extracellular repeat protein
MSVMKVSSIWALITLLTLTGVTLAEDVPSLLFGRPAPSYCAVDLGFARTPPTATLLTNARDINNFGQIAGTFATVEHDDDGSVSDIDVQAYIWDLREGMRLLGVLPGTDVSQGDAITAFGTVIGTSFSSVSPLQTTFVWDRRRGLRSIDILLTPGGRSNPADINRRGEIVGFSTIASGEAHAFLRESDGEVLDLDPFGAQSSSFATGSTTSGR